MSQSIVFGIAITHTHIHAGLVSEDSALLAMSTSRVVSSKSAADIAKQLLTVLEGLLSEAKLKRKNLKAVGVSSITPLLYQELEDSLSQALGVPTLVTHTGNGAALAEITYGMAGDWRNFIAISLDADLQCGIVLGGKLAMGENYMAGGLGHMLVHLGADKHERLMEHVSEQGIKRTAWKLLADMPQDSVLKNYNYHELQARHVVEAALAKDIIALEVFSKLGAVLGLKLSDVVHHFSPEAIIFTSSMPEVPSLLLATAKEYLDKNTLAVFRGKAQLFISALASAEAPILRAAAIAWHKLIM